MRRWKRGRGSARWLAVGGARPGAAEGSACTTHSTCAGRGCWRGGGSVAVTAAAEAAAATETVSVPRRRRHWNDCRHVRQDHRAVPHSARLRRLFLVTGGWRCLRPAGLPQQPSTATPHSAAQPAPVPTKRGKNRQKSGVLAAERGRSVLPPARAAAAPAVTAAC